MERCEPASACSERSGELEAKETGCTTGELPRVAYFPDSFHEVNGVAIPVVILSDLQ